MNKPQLGSVSSGTMRPEDLIPVFADELERLVPKRSDQAKLVRRARKLKDYDSEDAGYVLDDLFEALDLMAPAYCHFGANEGDGADYGFWPCIDALEESAREGDALKVGDLSEVPRHYVGHVMVVSDHGNVTLYEKVGRRGKFHELWSCV